MLNKKIDFSKRAKPTGLRFKGSHKKLGSKYYKRPERVLSAQGLERAKESGVVYLDNRLTKGDMRQSDRFAHGGIIKSVTDFFTGKTSLHDIFG